MDSAQTIDKAISALSDWRTRYPEGEQLVVELLVDDPAAGPELVVAAAERLENSVVLIEAVVEVLPDSALPEIARQSLAALQDDKDPTESQAAALIALLSTQAPQTLQPYLSEIWAFRPNRGTYYEPFPWRGASSEDIDRLFPHLTKGDPEIAGRAWRCVLECRSEDAISIAVDQLGPAVREQRWRGDSLADVGLELVNGRYRKLFWEPTYHIMFPRQLLTPQSLGSSGPEFPTWQSEGDPAGSGRFGGSVETTCKVCGSKLHRLLSIDDPPPAIGLHADIVTCLSCLGWSESPLFFSHQHGLPVPAGPVLAARPPEFPAAPIPATTVELVETPSRWRLQDWALSNGRQNLNRLGGEPTWIQGPEYPRCPECGSTMRFILQFDSLGFDDGTEWLWGSGGILYAFWCEDCVMSATLWQCT